MIDKDAHLGAIRDLRSRQKANCRKAARLLYTASQLGKAAEFIWRHRRDAEPDEIVVCVRQHVGRPTNSGRRLIFS